MKEIFMFGIIEIGYPLFQLMIKKMNLQKKKYICLFIIYRLNKILVIFQHIILEVNSF